MSDQQQAPGADPFNSRLVATVTAIVALTILGALHVITGDQAFYGVIGLGGGYPIYRYLTKPKGVL